VFAADDHADALIRILRGCLTSTEERAVMRRALRRLGPSAERHALALALAWDGSEDETERARVFSHVEAVQPMWLMRQDHGGDEHLRVTAQAVGLDLSEVVASRAVILGAARALGWRLIRPFRHEDIERLIHLGAWARLEELAQAGQLSAPDVVEMLTEELEAWVSEPDWRRWDPLAHPERTTFAWAHIWPAHKRDALRRAVARAVREDDGYNAWLLDDIAAWVVPSSPS
jgi:hypothetical protein